MKIDSAHWEELTRIHSGRWREWTRNDTVRSRAPIQSGSIVRSDRPHSRGLIRTCVFSAVEGMSTLAVAGFDRTVRPSTSWTFDGGKGDCPKNQGWNRLGTDCLVYVGTEVDGEEGRVATINDRTAQAGPRNRTSIELVCPSHHTTGKKSARQHVNAGRQRQHARSSGDAKVRIAPRGQANQANQMDLGGNCWQRWAERQSGSTLHNPRGSQRILTE
jgi:hypothetical protein